MRVIKYVLLGLKEKEYLYVGFYCPYYLKTLIFKL